MTAFLEPISRQETPRVGGAVPAQHNDTSATRSPAEAGRQQAQALLAERPTASLRDRSTWSAGTACRAAQRRAGAFLEADQVAEVASGRGHRVADKSVSLIGVHYQDKPSRQGR